MRMRVMVVCVCLCLCVCVCVLSIYWLLKKFIQQIERTNGFYANLQRFSTTGFL